MKRSAYLNRKTPLRAVNPERLAARREKQFGPQSALCKALPCLVEGCTSEGPSDPAHVRSRGAGGLDSDTVPLCRTHHDEQHRIGVASFCERYGVELDAAAALIDSELTRLRSFVGEDAWRAGRVAYVDRRRS